MFSKHTPFGKALIIAGYVVGVFVLLFAFIATVLNLSPLADGIAEGGSPMNIGDYVGRILFIFFSWFAVVCIVALTHLLRTSGSKTWCRIWAAPLCVLFPFGTLYSVLVFVYLARRPD
jgi:hypothetical protein